MKYRLLAVILILFLFDSTINACSICTTALADQLLPPIIIWMLFSVGWYIFESILITVFHKKVWGIPTIGWALVVIIAFFILGAAFPGMGLSVLLLIPVFKISIASFFMKAYSIYGKKFVIAQRILGSIGSLGFLILITSSIYIHINRTPAEFFLRWQGTTPANIVLKQILKERDEALPDLKVVIQHCDSIRLKDIVSRILSESNSEKDVPYLIDVLDIFQEKGYMGEAGQVEGKLRNLSGLDLEPGIPAIDWKKAWEERKFET